MQSDWRTNKNVFAVGVGYPPPAALSLRPVSVKSKCSCNCSEAKRYLNCLLSTPSFRPYQWLALFWWQSFKCILTLPFFTLMKVSPPSDKKSNTTCFHQLKSSVRVYRRITLDVAWRPFFMHYCWYFDDNCSSCIQLFVLFIYHTFFSKSRSVSCVLVEDKTFCSTIEHPRYLSQTVACPS